MARLHEMGKGYEKGSEKGQKREVENREVHSTVAFFRPFFAFFLFHPKSHVGPIFFFGFTPFLHVEIEKGKTPRRKMEAIQKREQKGAKKGIKKATVYEPNHNAGGQAKSSFPSAVLSAQFLWMNWRGLPLHTGGMNEIASDSVAQ
jgi:hypothetical protein